MPPPRAALHVFDGETQRGELCADVVEDAAVGLRGGAEIRRRSECGVEHGRLPFRIEVASPWDSSRTRSRDGFCHGPGLQRDGRVEATAQPEGTGTTTAVDKHPHTAYPVGHGICC